MSPGPSSRTPLFTVDTRSFSSGILGGGDDGDAAVPRPLWPKTPLEWFDLFLQFAYAALLLSLYYSGRCPAIPLSSACVIGNSACLVVTGALRFVFGSGEGLKR